MSESFIEYQELAGKVVEHVRFYTNPTSPPEVHMRFTDGTSLSLKFSVGFKVDGEYYRHEQGEIVTLRNYDPILAL